MSILLASLLVPVIHIQGEISVYSYGVYAKLKELPVDAPVNVVIDSQGGVVTLANIIGEELSKVNATCYVKAAASAALQIIMPRCKRIIASEKTVLQFHATHISGFISLKELDRVKMDLTENDSHMAGLMRREFGIFKCPSDSSWSELSPDCLRGAFHSEYSWNATTWNAHWVHNPKKILVLPSQIFDEVAK